MESCTGSLLLGFHPAVDKAEKDPEEGGMRPNQMVLLALTARLVVAKWGFAQRAPGIPWLFWLCAAAERALQNHHYLVPENEVLNVLEGEDAETNRCAQNVVARNVARRWTAISSSET